MSLTNSNSSIMQLFAVALLSISTLCAAQQPTFRYTQQFGQGIGAAPVLSGFEDNRTFRLRQLHPVVGVNPGIVAPIPVARTVVEPVAPLAATPLKARRVVKKVRVQEKPLELATPFVDTVQVASPRADTGIITEEIDAEEEKRLREEQQAKNAHYSFSNSVTDSIYDNAIARSETRDGLALTGMYSYSDGFFRRTVHYQADQDGYRVVKEEIEPIGQGPVFNLKGRADVESSLSGRYSITADDINIPNKTAELPVIDTRTA